MTPAALGGIGYAVELFWKISHVLEVQSGMLMHKCRLCCLKTVSQIYFGNKRWTQYGISGECKAWTEWTGIKYALRLMRKIVSKAEEWWMVISTEVVMQISWNKHHTINVVHSTRLTTNSCSSWPWALETLPHTEMPSAILRPAFLCRGILEFLCRWWVNDPAN